jgi:CheY-like chemotaxis protein
MPMMTGLEAIREIRALYSTINARIKHAALN